MIARRHLFALAAGGAGALALPRGARASGPRAELWERWARHDPAATARVDHGAWDAFLARHLQVVEGGVNRIAYGAVPSADRQALAAYLDALAATQVSTLNRAEQRAYWINFYNALTVKVVLDHHPVASIGDIDISPGLFANGPWGKKLATVEGEALSLDDMEHRILRPIWRDPRIHYAVNCASIGCPNLRTVAFTAANADRLMEEGARDYVNHPRGASLAGGRLVVSKIYDWFKADFGGTDAGVIAHLRQYAAPPLADGLAVATRIADTVYDWSLNDAPSRS